MGKGELFPFLPFPFSTVFRKEIVGFNCSKGELGQYYIFLLNETLREISGRASPARGFQRVGETTFCEAFLF